MPGGKGVRPENRWSPIQVADEDLRGWTEGVPAPLTAARLWARYAPRGKGAIPRLLGRTFGRNWKRFIRTKRGACLAIEATSLDIYARILNQGGVWEEPVFEACSSMLSDGSVFYDVGANVGFMSIEMGMVHHDRVTVFSFEPQPSLACAVARSAHLTGLARIGVFELMLGDHEGSAELFLVRHSGHASMAPRERHAKRLARTLATVDGMVGSGCIPAPDVIKLDVEGAELKVLFGARQTIAAARPGLVFEANENMERFGHTVRDLLDLVTSLAPYDFFVLVAGGGDVFPIEKWSGRDRHVDIVAVPRGARREKLGGFLQPVEQANG
jgi:FkbM family methyltransferase